MRETWVSAGYRALGRIAGSLPPRVGYGLSEGVGRLVYRTMPNLRRTLSHNVGHVLGPGADDARMQAIVRRACVNITKQHYDLFRVSRMDAGQIRDLVQLQGWQNLTSVLAEGRGAIIVSAHMGSVDIVLQLPAVHGLPMIAPAEHIQPEEQFQWVMRVRQAHGVRLIPADGPVIEIFRALKRGELVCLGCDRDVTDSGYPVRFFGAATSLPSGPVRVALRTGAPLVPAFAGRLPDNTLTLRVEPPLRLAPTGNEEADVEAGMQLLVATLERAIAQQPDQWLVTVPIWPE